jgi:hypothetical protein
LERGQSCPKLLIEFGKLRAARPVMFFMQSQRLRARINNSYSGSPVAVEGDHRC